MDTWKDYSDKSVNIIAHTSEGSHNTITPIARRKKDYFELDIVLRNNRTTDEFPEGIFHPHKDVQHIKKENIGLIEVMGLAVLPGRLKEELSNIRDYLIGESTFVDSIHQEWAQELKDQYRKLEKNKAQEVIEYNVGQKFEQVLEHAAVYKNTSKGQKAFIRFIKKIVQ